MSSNVINMTTSIMKVTTQIRITDKPVKEDQEYLYTCRYESGVVKVWSTICGIKVIGCKGDTGFSVNVVK